MNEGIPTAPATEESVHATSDMPTTHASFVPSQDSLLFGHVVRPPSIWWDHSPVSTSRLVNLDADAACALPGVVDIVVRGNFIGIVATSDSAARRAAASLRIKWSPRPPESAVGQDQAPAHHVLVEHGDVTAALRNAHHTAEATYRWPLKETGAESACWAIADCHDDEITVWAATTMPAALRVNIAALLGFAPHQVTLVCIEDSPPSIQQVHHVAADAALLSHAVGRPVKVHFAGEPVAVDDRLVYPLVSHISSAIDDNGAITAYSASTSATPPPAPPLALVLTGMPSPITEVSSDPDTAVPPYVFPHLRVAMTKASGAAPVADPTQAASMGHVFAHESHLDEIAAMRHIDPVELRLRQLDDIRGAKLIGRVTEQANWSVQTPDRLVRKTGIRHGRGFAYASAVETDAGRDVRSWSAWVVDVEVDSFSGEITVSRVVVGHDAEHDAAKPASAQAIENHIVSATRSLTSVSPSIDHWDIAAVPRAEPADVPQTQLPTVDLIGTPTLPAPVLRGGGSAMLPAAAAVANAIFDATGVRLREPPFNAEKVRLGLQNGSAGSKRKRGLYVTAALAVAGLAASVMPWRTPIAPVSPPDPGFYSAATIERGRLVAAAGDCVVCHTGHNGVKNAGGLPLETPFGTIYSTNITPDPETGIGKWSYAAFERAMRQGIHRDGRHLYPAFPYTAFAKVSDNDLHALYAYLMSQPAVRSEVPETNLAFPFSVRPLMAGWNMLFHRTKPFEPNPAQSVEWNRGAYLAEGLGHCSACHSPRNIFGAEKTGMATLTGGMAEGWEAPSLTSLSKAPIPWTEEELFRYLRFGYSPLHGPAAGPMAPVIEGLAELPESDVRAIAIYISSFNKNAPDSDSAAEQARLLEERSLAADNMQAGSAARLYEGACAVCHQANQGTPLFGEKPPLALNTNLHSALPDNLIHVLLKGIDTPLSAQTGYMPAFGESLNDKQLTELVHYLRTRFAPDEPAWQNVPDTIRRIRDEK